MCPATGHGENRKRGSGDTVGNTQHRCPGSALCGSPGPGLGAGGESPARSGAASYWSRAVQLASPCPTNEIKGGAQSGSLPGAPRAPFLRRAGARRWAWPLLPFSLVSAFGPAPAAATCVAGREASDSEVPPAGGVAALPASPPSSLSSSQDPIQWLPIRLISLPQRLRPQNL